MRTRSGFPTSIAVPLTLALGLGTTAGCERIKQLTGGAEDEASEDAAAAEDAEAAEAEAPPPVDPSTPAVEVARKELPPAAVVEPETPEPLAGLDALLALVPEGKLGEKEDITTMVVVRDPEALVNLARDSAGFMQAPMVRLEAALGSDEIAADMAKPMFASYKEGAARSAEVLAKVESSGIAWDKGALFVETKKGSYAIVASENPDALKALMAAVADDLDAEKSVCKAIEGQAPYAVCADSQSELDNYAPGGAEEYESLRAAMEARMPGKEIDNANVLLFAENNWITVSTPPGLMVLSVLLESGSDEIKELEEGLAPGGARLLRDVEPGAGFVWMNMNKDALTSQMKGNPMAEGFGAALTGEVVFSGHYEPSALSLQLGITDPAAVEPLLVMAEAAKSEIPKTLDAVPGSEVVFQSLEIPVGSEKAKAVHLGLRNVPEADVLAKMTGLTMDAWAFAANGALVFAVGASPEAIGRTADSTGEGASESLAAYLPAALRKDLAAGEVSMVMHLPFDALHGPETHRLVDAAFKNVEAVDAETVKAALALMSPLSSATVWITHHGESVQVHVAAQAIGSERSDEGKDALAAARSVAAGGDPAEAFGPLLTRYASSPRLAAYRARAGDTNDALVASGVGALAAVGALSVPMFLEQRNEAILAEMGVEAGAAEEASEVSKLDPETPIGEKEAAAPKTTTAPKTTKPKEKTPATDKKPKEEAKPADDAKPKEEAKPADDAKPKEEAKPADDAKPKEEAKPADDAKPKIRIGKVKPPADSGE